MRVNVDPPPATTRVGMGATGDGAVGGQQDLHIPSAAVITLFDPSQYAKECPRCRKHPPICSI